MNGLKRKLRGWLVPELEAKLQAIDEFMQEVTKAKRELQAVDKDITFEKPVVFLGSLVNCKVDVKPTLKPEITLAKVDIPAGLMASGDQQIVTGCYFRQEPNAVKFQPNDQTEQKEVSDGK